MAKKCRVMIVDDEKDIVITLKEGLEKSGFEVDAFTSPSEALAAYNVEIHKVLIIDVRMPGLSGIQLFKKIRHIDPKSKVLFLTAFEIQEKEWHIVLPNIEVHGFIKKPVRIKDLVSAIAHAKASGAR